MRVFIVSAGKWSDCRIYGVFDENAKGIYVTVVSQIKRNRNGSPYVYSLLEVVNRYSLKLDVTALKAVETTDAWVEEGWLCRVGIAAMEANGFHEIEYSECNTCDYPLRRRS